jgi:hypothetical protein
VRDGKGGKDRRTLLPERLADPLRSHTILFCLWRMLFQYVGKL